MAVQALLIPVLPGAFFALMLLGKGAEVETTLEAVALMVNTTLYVPLFYVIDKRVGERQADA